MRIVYVVSLFPCWSETFIVREIHALIAAGADIRIVSLKHAHESMVQSEAQALCDRVIYPRPLTGAALTVLLEVLLRPDLTLRDLARMIWAFRTSPGRLAKSLVAWWRVLSLAPVVRGLNADRLHAHWATYPTTAVQALAPRVGLPYSFTCHAHDIFVESHFLASKLREADFAVTISQFNVQFLSERVGPMARERLQVVHCGIDPAQIPFTTEGRDPRLIVSVGRLDRIKGFETLIDALAVLADRGEAFHCVIVGEGPLRKALQTRIDDASLAHRVELPGARPAESVAALLAVAGLFVLPSRVTDDGDRDGIPVALMEAMAAGLPVVSTTVSGIPELIESTVHGLLVPPDDAPALARAIGEQFQRPLYAARMAQRARARIEKDFHVGTETARLHRLMRGARDGLEPSLAASHD